MGFEIHLPICGIYVSGLVLIVLGLGIGFMSGFFGVGGGIIAVPMLHAFFNIPYPIAIGSSLALIIGTSVSAAYRHHIHNNINYKLALVFVVGTLPGVELGARVIQNFKNLGSFHLGGSTFNTADFIISFVYMLLLCVVGELMFRESRVSKATSRNIRDSEAMKGIFLSRIHGVRARPIIRISIEDDSVISFWIILALSIGVGFITGFLGVGGGFVLVPALVYLMRIRTRIAVGTSTVCIIFSSLYGTLTHTIKGNVDIVLVVILLVGSTVGAQFGAIAMRKCSGPVIRFYFSILAFGAAIIAASKTIGKLILRH